MSVRIAERSYILNVRGEPQTARRAAAYIDRRVGETMAGGNIDRETAAIAAAVYTADELIRAQDENRLLRMEIDELRKR